jgi:hypothetical protein
MNSTSTSKNSRATRSSLACLPCRSRHKKCDGNRPSCARCAEVGKQCSYARSRRGGLDRAALAECRERLALAEGITPVGDPSPQRSATTQQVQECTSQLVEVEFPHEFGLPDRISIGDENSGILMPLPTLAHVGNIENDALIDSYYKNFHKFHPFLLPRKHFTRIYQDPSRQPAFIALIAVVRLIGNIFSSHKWSIPLKDYTDTCFLQALPSDPIMVQCRLLYSMALFWYDYMADAKLEMDTATRLAIDLEMFRPEFAEKHGAEDPLVKECWRRTWWMLYIVDAYYAGTLGTMNFAVVDIDATVELPCEELDYESGVSTDSFDFFWPFLVHAGVLVFS